jgi:hypothetical protein
MTRARGRHPIRCPRYDELKFASIGVVIFFASIQATLFIISHNYWLLEGWLGHPDGQPELHESKRREPLRVLTLY